MADVLIDIDASEQREGTGLASVDLVLDMLELLASSSRPRRLTEIARELDISKSRAHRHLRAMVQRGYIRQDVESDRYEVAIKLLALGEAVRDRFDLLTAMRPQMARLREATLQTVTASALVDGAVVVLELLYGRTAIEFGVKPGTTLDYHASAHGLVALAFGPPDLMERVLSSQLTKWTDKTITESDELRAAVEQVRRQGWATAPDQVMLGVNALAAPVFDFDGICRGGIALVGSTQFINTPPARQQVEDVLAAAEAVSRYFGWKAKAA